MLDNIDSFLALSRNNTSVKAVDLYPFYDYSLNSEFWDKVGQIVGNLTELNRIEINFYPYDVDVYDFYDDYSCFEVRRPDWEILIRILSHLRQKVRSTISFGLGFFGLPLEQIQGFARAIYGHPMLWDFDFQELISFVDLGPWCSAMATLPSLKRVRFGLWEPESEEERVLLNLEPLKELLRTPALRVVQFDDFYFNNELCYAIANALEEGSSITDMIFDDKCAFPDGGRAIIANALKTNASVIKVTGLDP
jgi:hypothetical protein